MTKYIYKQQGILGFYAGVIPNGVRVTLKSAYRWPMMLSFPTFYESILPEFINKNLPSTRKILTGGTIASLETFIIYPLERLKVSFMTSDTKERSFVSFFNQNKSHLTKELFRGLNALYQRQIVSWISFLVADDKFKAIARRYTEKEELNFYNLLCVSFCVGAVNTLTTMPMDCVKTQLQMGSILKSGGVFDVMKNTIKKHGITGLYAGWKPQLIKYMINSIFTVTLLEKWKLVYLNLKILRREYYHLVI